MVWLNLSNKLPQRHCYTKGNIRGRKTAITSANNKREAGQRKSNHAEEEVHVIESLSDV